MIEPIDNAPTIPPPPQTVTYWAISVLTSRMMWLGLLTTISGILSLPEVMALIPLRYLPAVLSGIGFVIMVLRKQTIRPVAFIAPGDVMPVRVPKISPPAQPPLVTD